MFDFIIIAISMCVFAFAYGIKGGQGEKIFSNWSKKVDISHKLASLAIVILFCSFTTVFLQINLGVGTAWQSIFYICIAWLVAIAPSMGEEYGALMGRDYPVDENDKGIKKIRIPVINKTLRFRREIEYGVKKAIQRGVWMGAIMTLATGYIPFIWFSFLFAPVAAICLNYAPKIILDRWGWSEIFVGGIVFGLPFGLMII